MSVVVHLDTSIASVSMFNDKIKMKGLDFDKQLYYYKRCVDTIMEIHKRSFSRAELRRLRNNIRKLNMDAWMYNFFVDLGHIKRKSLVKLLRFNDCKEYVLENMYGMCVCSQCDGLRVSKRLMRDRDVLLEAFKHGCNYFRHTLTDDFEIMLYGVETSLTITRKIISPVLYRNKSFVLGTLDHTDSLFCYTSDDLRNDKDVIMSAIRKYSHLLMYASYNMRNDIEVVKTAVSTCISSFQYASVELKSNKEIVLDLMKEFPRVYNYAADSLKRDKQLISYVCLFDREAASYVHNDAFYMKDMLFLLLESNHRVYRRIPQNLQCDKDVFVHTIKCIHNSNNSGYGYMFNCCDIFNGNKEVFREILPYNGLLLAFASKSVVSDKELVLLACTQNSGAFQYATVSMKKDESFVVQCMEHNRGVYMHISDDLKGKREIVYLALDSPNMFIYVPVAYRSDFTMAMKALKGNLFVFDLLDVILQYNKEILLVVAKSNIRDIRRLLSVNTNICLGFLCAMKEGRIHEIMKYVLKMYMGNKAIYSFAEHYGFSVFPFYKFNDRFKIGDAYDSTKYNVFINGGLIGSLSTRDLV